MMKKMLPLALSLLLVLCATSCANNTQQPSNIGNSVQTTDFGATSVSQITVASQEWEALDPYQAEGLRDEQELVISPLFHREVDGSLSPNVASGYTISDDGLTITITLPEGLKFHDGSPLTPEDVKRSIEWGMEISPYNTDYCAIERIEVDGNNVVLHLTNFSTTVLYYLGDPFMGIMKASELDSMSEEELLWNATTYGAYYVDEFVPGSHVTLKRNEYYQCLNPHLENHGAPYVETITVRFVTDEFALAQGLVAGELDLVPSFPVSSLSELAKNENLTTFTTPLASVFRFLLNNDSDIFSDDRVCEAIMLLVNREEIAEYSQAVSPAYAYVVAGMNDQSPEAEEYFKTTYCNNPERAKELLSEAGWKDTDGDGYLDKDGQKFIFTFTYYENYVTKLMAEMLQIQFKDAGIMMELEAVDSATRNMKVETDDNYDASTMGFYWGDTSSTLLYIVEDDNIFEDNAYFELCNDTAIVIDDESRAEQFGVAQKMLMDTKRNFPVLVSNRVAAYNMNKLEGIYISGEGKFYYNDIK